MTDHINYFEPYVRKEAHHEDQLTRAFLVVLKHVPVAHAAWLALVDESHRANEGQGVDLLHRLSEPTFHTQVREIPDEVERVVSVVQTDERFAAEGDATKSDRSQILDGVVSYPPDLAIVIENKPDVRHVWDEQLNVNIPEGVEHDPRVASVRWRDVIVSFTTLLTSGHVSGSERILMEDFLAFVERRFPALQPFTQFGVCGRDLKRLERRGKAILEEIAPGNVHYHRGWAWYIRLPKKQAAAMAALRVTEAQDDILIHVQLVPGDTMSQARRFYDRVDVDRLLALQDKGWTITPNLHLAFMSSNLVWTHTKRVTLADYLRYWRENRSKISQVSRADFEELFDSLVETGFAEEEDRAEFARHFLETSRTKLNLCPAVNLHRYWELDEAVRLDAGGAFVGIVREEMLVALATWKDHMPESIGD